MSTEQNAQSFSGQVVVEKEPNTKLKKPDMFHVVLLNDDFTPMDFVVMVIQKVFHRSQEESTQLMLDVHNSGRSVVGIYPKDVAETKVFLVKNLAEKEGHPLECIVELAGEAP